MKPKLLTVELWAIGDLVLATPFLRAAARLFEVTLLAGPVAAELQPRLWPGVEVIPFQFPWDGVPGKICADAVAVAGFGARGGGVAAAAV